MMRKESIYERQAEADQGTVHFLAWTVMVCGLSYAIPRAIMNPGPEVLWVAGAVFVAVVYLIATRGGDEEEWEGAVTGDDPTDEMEIPDKPDRPLPIEGGPNLRVVDETGESR